MSTWEFDLAVPLKDRVTYKGVHKYLDKTNPKATRF